MNKEHIKEAGKVFGDLSKYLITTVAISGLFGPEIIKLTAVLVGMGLKDDPPF